MVIMGRVSSEPTIHTRAVLLTPLNPLFPDMRRLNPALVSRSCVLIEDGLAPARNSSGPPHLQSAATYRNVGDWLEMRDGVWVDNINTPIASSSLIWTFRPPFCLICKSLLLAAGEIT